MPNMTAGYGRFSNSNAFLGKFHILSFMIYLHFWEFSMKRYSLNKPLQIVCQVNVMGIVMLKYPLLNFLWLRQFSFFSVIKDQK